MTDTSYINIASHLPIMAKRQPFRQAVVFPHGRDKQGRVSYTHLTYQQLDHDSDMIARGLASVGITKGIRTVLMVKPSLEFFSLVFALFKNGAVMVAVDPGMGVRNLGKCLAEAEPHAFIGIPKAHTARRLLRWAKGSIKTNILVGKSRRPGGMLTLDDIRKHDYAEDKRFPCLNTKASDNAAVLFTSGSTGIPKGVVYTHANFEAQVKALKAAYDILPGEIDLATFPLFALYAPALGMTAIIPDMDFTRPGKVDPKKIIEPIENFGVTNMFGSPALLNRLGRYTESLDIKFPTLKRVISAGAPVPSNVLARIEKLLTGHAQVYTPYGATESLPVCSIGSQEILSDTSYQTNKGQGVCVGKPVGDISVKVIKITDDLIDTWSDDLLAWPGQTGEIVVQGPVVTRQYFGREESTRLAKIADPENNSFYHRMGDLGYFDTHGRLWFCGRKSQRVITEHGELYTVPCESIFNTHPQVFRSALVGVDDKPDGSNRPVICIELEADAKSTDKAKLTEELLQLAQQFEHTRSIRNILYHKAFPVDIRHNAKIDREQLSRWAKGQLS